MDLYIYISANTRLLQPYLRWTIPYVFPFSHQISINHGDSNKCLYHCCHGSKQVCSVKSRQLYLPIWEPNTICQILFLYCKTCFVNIKSVSDKESAEHCSKLDRHSSYFANNKQSRGVNKNNKNTQKQFMSEGGVKKIKLWRQATLKVPQKRCNPLVWCPLGDRTSHESLLPQCDQPVEPQLLCLLLVHEQLRNNG